MFDWKATLATVAPAIAGMVGTPIAGIAVKAGLAAFGITGEDIPADPATAESLLARRVQSATPDELLALKQENHQFTLDMEKLDIKRDELAIEDTQDARSTHGDDEKVFWLGIVVLFSFAVLVSFSLYGAFLLLTDEINLKNPGMLATVVGLVGTIIGYAAGNAQQVIAFFFGSSRGSKQKTDAMAAAFQDAGKWL